MACYSKFPATFAIRTAFTHENIDHPERISKGKLYMYVYNELLADKYIIKAPYNCTNEFYEIVVAAPELYVQNL